MVYQMVPFRMTSSYP